ncbi:intramembrane zinc metalloprotease RseP [Gammaproteobacteria bacterium]
MDELLLSLGSFLVTLGLLVTVHEFGHFWVARRLGVKVLRFSVGFGKPLWSRRAGADQTEYVIGMLPLGGYVNMLDETEAPVDAEEVHRAFNRQGVGRRMAIVVAGPVANLLFAVVAYWLMFIIGVTGVRPLLGIVEPGTPAARAGFSAGEEIISVEGSPTPTWEAVTIALLQNSMDQEVVRLETVGPSEKHHIRSINVEGVMLGEPGTALHDLGFHPGRFPLIPVLDTVEPGGAAFKAGLEPGDRIRSANDQPIEYWEQWVEYVRTHPGQTIQIEVDHLGGHRALTIVPVAQAGPHGATVGRIGASVRIPEGYGERLRADLSYPPKEALGAALTKVREMSILTLRLLGKMIEGEASVDNLSGPLSIAQLAGKSAAVGLSPFLAFLGLVSLSLGVLNLFPIPVLDGGHLLYYLIELVTGKPLPEWILAWGQKLGTALLLSLMTLAVFNDLNRLFGS